MTYFTKLFRPMLVINDDIINTTREFYNVVGSVMNEDICMELNANFLEDELEKVLMHLLNGNSPSWDGFKVEVFKKYKC